MAEFEESYAFVRSLTGPRLEVACAVDGSQVGMKALDLAISFMQKARGDTLDLIHVVDPSHASPTFTPALIKHECELKATHAGITVDFHIKEKLPEGVEVTISQAAEFYKADLLVVGATGLKVEHDNKTQENTFAVMGSVSDGSLRRSDVSVAVVKSTSYDVEAPNVSRVFMLATSDSPAALVAFALMVTKLAKKTDKVFIVYGGEDASIMDKYKVECGKLGMECELRLLGASETNSASLADAIVECARSNQVDVLMLGTNAFSKNVLGSVSDACVKAARCTTVVVKDPRQGSTDQRLM
mmetsp:Transcript_31122/g.77446  ORF Transcript_31122/g.77446 Transcript_31122/m.77446 type:complete len:299 (+) Transcript_31122:143-1039(+)|eukprot:CAMPEP_0197576000 /NCGR_PEP_ID=MMETSP1326-20131121/1181_1 /TAXON_ID=1155430 /ORGANISM="Genus nov. species nov., Strain RCC2288" /LENGTH=298 /DNA_ID=CAMNT_0043138849 /DNA_START=138 /DNA_END=1034 /DNA_ORIENTATION=+